MKRNLAAAPHRVITFPHAAGFTDGIQEMKLESRFLEQGAADFCPNDAGQKTKPNETSQYGSQYGSGARRFVPTHGWETRTRSGI
jgi:hypothetical protein